MRDRPPAGERQAASRIPGSPLIGLLSEESAIRRHATAGGSTAECHVVRGYRFHRPSASGSGCLATRIGACPGREDENAMTDMYENCVAERKPEVASWLLVRDALVPQLSEDDDTTLWEVALNMILRRTKADASLYRGDQAILVQIGRCSHWIRPKWKTDSGMTWPFGYDPTVPPTGGGQSWSFRNLPDFDWSVKWRIEPASGAFAPVRGQPTRRPLCHRICIPARTLRHPQATVHTIWTPGAPETPSRKWTMLYGLKRTKRGWRCFTKWEGERAWKGS